PYAPRRAEAPSLAAPEEFRATRASTLLVAVLVDLGRLLLGTGRTDEARARLEEARELATSIHHAGDAALASGYLALAGAGDVAPLEAAIAARPPVFSEGERLDALRGLWKATGDAHARAHAKALAAALIASAPAAARPVMRERLPLLREILSA